MAIKSPSFLRHHAAHHIWCAAVSGLTSKPSFNHPQSTGRSSLTVEFCRQKSPCRLASGQCAISEYHRPRPDVFGVNRSVNQPDYGNSRSARLQPERNSASPRAPDSPQSQRCLTRRSSIFFALGQSDYASSLVFGGIVIMLSCQIHCLPLSNLGNWT